MSRNADFRAATRRLENRCYAAPLAPFITTMIPPVISVRGIGLRSVHQLEGICVVPFEDGR